MVARSSVTSATEQDGPMEACIWNGHSYVAATVRAAPANPAVMSPRELTVLSVVRAARISRWRSAMSGSVADSCQVTLRAWAARIACSSRSATTPPADQLGARHAPSRVASERDDAIVDGELLGRHTEPRSCETE